MRNFFISITFLFILISQLSYSQIPRTISYQGILTDTTANAKPDGEYNFTFRLYESNTGGSALWSESKKLFVKKGLFTTNLGDQTPFGDDIKFDKPYWLSIQIESEAELSPRIALTSVGYSISSINSDTAGYAKKFKIDNGQLVRSINGLKDNITLTGDGGTTINTSGDTIKISSSSGSGTGIQGIQNTNNTLDITNPNGPTAKINVKIPFKLNSSSTDYLISAINSGSGAGIYGESKGSTGIVGSSTDLFGVSGFSKNQAGTSGESQNYVGILGLSHSSTNAGVLGKNDAGGFGIYGQSNTGNGVIARTYNANEYALHTDNSGTSNFCGLSSGKYAIYANGPSIFTMPMAIGLVTPTSELDVNGGSSSGAKVGIHGSSNDNSGIYGTSNTYAGLFGESGSSFGVWARTYGNYALYSEYTNNGTNSCYLSNKQWSIFTTGPAYFTGDVNVHNIIYHTSTFKIDHPLDPSNKYLSHSVVESPDMMNVYNGNIITDASGSATVSLPSYFQSLNIDYRYQLTVIGQFAEAIVENEISNNQFTIKTDKPNVKVSWQVTGIRNDAYAKANPMIVEQEKAQSERGKYLSPELFGQPKEMGINYVKPPVSQENDKK